MSAVNDNKTADPLAGSFPVKQQGAGAAPAAPAAPGGAPTLGVTGPASTSSTTPGLNAAEEALPVFVPINLGQHGPANVTKMTVGQFVAYVQSSASLTSEWTSYLNSLGLFSVTAVQNGTRAPTPAELRNALEQVAMSAAVRPDQNLDSWLSDRATQNQATTTAGTQTTGSARFFKGTTTEIGLTQPGAVEAIGNQVATSLIGRRLTADEVGRITSAINTQEMSEGTVRAQAAQAQQAGLYEAYTGGSEGGAAPAGTVAGGPPGPPLTGVTGPLASFMSAERQQESGNYNAPPNAAGAKGAYQILTSNWSQWAKDAGLGPNAEWTPENQDKVASAKFTQLYNDLGHNWGAVAVAWYAGEGTAKAWLADPHNPRWDAAQSGGPSINDYARQVMAKFAAQPGTTAGGPGINAPGTAAAAPPAPAPPAPAAPGTTSTPVGGPVLPTAGVPAAGTYTLGRETTFTTPTGTDYVEPAQAAVTQTPLSPEQMTSAALMNFDSPEYQAHNLLNVFGTIAQALGAGTPGAGKGVLNTPVKVA